MNARDLPYEVHYIDEPLPEDMQGEFADLAGVRYEHDCVLFGVDHIAGPGCAGRVVAYKRMSGDLNLCAELENGVQLLLIWAGKWIVRIEDPRPSLFAHPIVGFTRTVGL